MFLLYRVSKYIVDLGFICLLPRYCFVCPILLGQVGVGHNGQITLAMVETTKSQATKNSLRGGQRRTLQPDFSVVVSTVVQQCTLSLSLPLLAIWKNLLVNEKDSSGPLPLPSSLPYSRPAAVAATEAAASVAASIHLLPLSAR